MKIRVLLALIILQLVVIGCLNNSDGPRIVVQTVDGGSLEITDSRKVLQVTEILNSLKWENTSIEIKRLPDYKFQILPKDKAAETKAVTYSVWVNPNKAQLIIFREDVHHSQLTNQDLDIIYEIITGHR